MKKVMINEGDFKILSQKQLSAILNYGYAIRRKTILYVASDAEQAKAAEYLPLDFLMCLNVYDDATGGFLGEDIYTRDFFDAEELKDLERGGEVFRGDTSYSLR